MAVLVPHFDLPFRLRGSSFAVVEQDSTEDISNCVEAIFRCPNGFRDDSPQFGLDDPTFSNMPLNLSSMKDQVVSQEPRAVVVLSENPDLIKEYADRVIVQMENQ